jgi:hypothetical protein
MDNAHSQRAEVPRSLPNVAPPADLYPTSDIRFVLVELGKISGKIDALSTKTEKLSSSVAVLEKVVDRAKTALYVGFTIIAMVGAFAWWALGDRITHAVSVGLEIPRFQDVSIKTSAPSAPSSPNYAPVN